MTASMTTDQGFIKFAKQLANKSRDKRTGALKKLKRWLVVQCRKGAMSYPAMLKLWKGLFYSMQYSDKPLQQEALAKDIADIMKLLPERKESLFFFRGFCETITREWICIHRSHHDKFNMFVKTIIRGVCEFCEFHSWNEELTDTVIGVLDERIINNAECPDSVLFTIAEHIYEIHADLPNIGFLTQLLKSYVTLISTSPKKELTQLLESKLFEPVRHQHTLVDGETLLGHIQTLAAQPGILTRNRKILHRLHNELSPLYGIQEIKSAQQQSLMKKGEGGESAPEDNPKDVEQSKDKDVLDKSPQSSAPVMVNLPEVVVTHTTATTAESTEAERAIPEKQDPANIAEKNQTNISSAKATPLACSETLVETADVLEQTSSSKSLTSEETPIVPATIRIVNSSRKRKNRTKSVIDLNSPLCTRSSKKRVHLSMENNQTFIFQKRSSLESPTPFDGTKTPVRSALKTSPAVTRSRKSVSRPK